MLQPNISDITTIPDINSDGQLLHEFNDTISLTCTAEGGPRIMTRWQFDDGSTVETVANDSSSVTYEISSLSTDHTGVYYCEAIIDRMTDTSMNYTLFGEYINIIIKQACKQLILETDFIGKIVSEVLAATYLKVSEEHNEAKFLWVATS